MFSSQSRSVSKITLFYYSRKGFYIASVNTDFSSQLLMKRSTLSLQNYSQLFVEYSTMQKFPKKYNANISKSDEVTASLANTTVACKWFCSLKRLVFHCSIIYIATVTFEKIRRHLITSGVLLWQQSLQNKHSTCVCHGKTFVQNKRASKINV